MAELSSPNFLQPTGFKLVIDRAQFGNFEFFASQVSHPSIDVGEAVLPFRRTDAKFPGDKIMYSQLSCDVMLDEDMKVYEELHNWLLRTQEGKAVNASDTQVGSTLKTEYDIQMLILTSHNNQIRQIRYIDAFPTDLGSVQFQSTTAGTEYLTFTVSFRFTYFELLGTNSSTGGINTSLSRRTLQDGTTILEPTKYDSA